MTLPCVDTSALTMHLALVESSGTRTFATADRILAAGAGELGLEVATFFTESG